MPGTPTVTVGLPFYNNKDTLLDAIRSVFAQTYEDWELILMDDGSTDGSLELARSIKDPRVRVVSDGQNCKLPARLNQIHREASGMYSARLDADDLLHPERLALQIAYLQEHREVDVVGTLMYSMNDQQGICGLQGTGALQFKPYESLDRAILMHATVTGKTQWFRDNPYDESFPRDQDRELWSRTCLYSRFATLDRPLYYVNEAEFSVAKFLQGMNSMRRIIRAYGPQLVGRVGTLKRLARTYAYGCIFSAFGLVRQERVLIRMKSQALTAEQLAEAKAAYDRIMSTPLPQEA
jgi:glycosyltransferase involved in cell wall biosynthesis